MSIAALEPPGSRADMMAYALLHDMALRLNTNFRIWWLYDLFEVELGDRQVTGNTLATAVIKLTELFPELTQEKPQ